MVRTVIEMSFIIFLFYSNLLMGEFEKSGIGQKRGYLLAFEDMFTIQNFIIALISSFTAHVIFENLRKKF